MRRLLILATTSCILLSTYASEAALPETDMYQGIQSRPSTYEARTRKDKSNDRMMRANRKQQKKMFKKAKKQMKRTQLP